MALGLTQLPDETGLTYRVTGADHRVSLDGALTRLGHLTLTDTNKGRADLLAFIEPQCLPPCQVRFITRSS